MNARKITKKFTIIMKKYTLFINSKNFILNSINLFCQLLEKSLRHNIPVLAISLKKQQML